MPIFSSTESKVVDSRPTEDGTSIRRRRECINCGKRFTTYEKIEEIPIMVIKKDGTRAPVDSEKKAPRFHRGYGAFGGQRSAGGVQLP